MDNYFNFNEKEWNKGSGKNGNIYYHYPRQEKEFKQDCLNSGRVVIDIYDKKGVFIVRKEAKVSNFWTSPIFTYVKTMTEDGTDLRVRYSNNIFFIVSGNHLDTLDKIKNKEFTANYWVFKYDPQNEDYFYNLKGFQNNFQNQEEVEWSNWPSAAKVGDKVFFFNTAIDNSTNQSLEIGIQCLGEIVNIKQIKYLKILSNTIVKDRIREKYPKLYHELMNNIGNRSRRLLPKDEAENLWNDALTLNEIDKTNKNGETVMPSKDNNSTKLSLNTILYGPPGTGKTYNTINKALEIIDGKVPDDRKEAVERFDELKTAGQIEFITFHQSYSYDDFVEGIKPDFDNNEISYKISEGIFKKISQLAEINQKIADSAEQKPLFEDVWKKLTENIDDSIEFHIEIPMKRTSFFITDFNETTVRFDKKIGSSKHTLSFKTLKQMYYDGKNKIIAGGLEPYYSSLLNYLFKLSENMSSVKKEKQNYVLIIDEINRGNISKIFGELITLIEEDKRLGAENELTVTLPYSKDKFGVPSNLYIIGTMNTADRSIALMDMALRRRFHFEEMMPKPELLDFVVNGVDIRQLLEAINKRIEFLYDRDHQIGHAYFMGIKNYKDLCDVFANKIIPLLQEYFYENWEKIQLVLGDHINQLKQKQVTETCKLWEDELNEKRLVQSIISSEQDILGCDHPDFEDSVKFRVNPKLLKHKDAELITSQAFIKIYG